MKKAQESKKGLEIKFEGGRREKAAAHADTALPVEAARGGTMALVRHAGFTSTAQTRRAGNALSRQCHLSRHRASANTSKPYRVSSQLLTQTLVCGIVVQASWHSNRLMCFLPSSVLHS